MVSRKARAEIPITANEQRAVRTLKKLVRHFKSSATEINSALELVGKGWRIVSAIPKLILRHLLEATRAANLYGRAVAEVTTIASAAEFPLMRIRAITFAMVSLYGSDVTLNANALYQAISAGATSAAQATEILHSANKLAIGGVTDVKTAVDGLTNVVNAYRKSGLTAADASDTLFVAIRDGKTNAQELATNLGSVAPLAAQLGVSFPELSAAIAAATGPGVATAEAVTQVRSALVGIIKETPKAKRAAKELGIEFNSTQLRAKGLRKFLLDIADTGATEGQLLALFGRVEGLNAVMTLTANNGERFTSFMGDMERRAGGTDEAFQKMTRTLDFQVTKFGALKNASMIALGQTVTDSKNAFQGMKALNAAMEELIDFFQSPAGKKAIDDFFGGISGWLADVLFAVNTLDEALREIQFRLSSFSFTEFLGATVGGSLGAQVGRAISGPGEGLVEEIGPDGLTSFERRQGAIRRLATRLREISLGRGDTDGPSEGGKNVLTPTNPNIPANDNSRGKGKKGGIETLQPISSQHIDDARLADRTAIRRAMTGPIQGQQDFKPAVSAGSTSGVGRDFMSVLGLPSMAELGSYWKSLKESFTTGLKGIGDSVTDFGAITANTFGIALQGVGSAFAEMLIQWDTGAFKAKIGEVLIGLGTMLIQTGLASSVLGALSFIPGLQLVTGPPGLAVAGGLLAAGAGAGMILAGKALGGGGVAGSAASPRAGSIGRGSAGGFAQSQATSGFNPAFAANDNQNAPQEVHLHFPGFVGDKRRAIREVDEGLRELGVLKPFGAAG